MTSARFDDLRPGRRRSFQLTGLMGEFAAHTVEDVLPALDRAAAAVAAGRWVAGWVAYEAAPAFDPAMVVRAPRGPGSSAEGLGFADLPLVWFAVFERREQVGGPSTGSGARSAGSGGWTPSIDAARHAADVAAIRDHIARGDTYQVNHTFRLSAPFDGEPAALYGRLAAAQRGGYGAFLQTDRWAVASASPELFFEWADGRLTTRPMKGTAPRGLDEAEDAQIRATLLASPKERAENLMIVDMVRNDLGRVAVPGTVGVPALFEAERYDTVWQLTSTVTARPRPGTTLADVFTALFPCASITGAPRSSTMRIIAERETTPRGVYCGAIGFGGPGAGGPEWAFNVGIRTVLVDRDAATAWYGTGGGITHDSTPAGEYAEALLKAEVLHRQPADIGLIETLLWTPGPGFGLLERHLARLAGSAHHFDVPLDVDAVRAALHGAVDERSTPSRVRLVLDREGGVTVTVADVPPARTAPVRAALDTVPGDSRDVFARHKTTRRERYEAAAARHPDADDVVLVNERGEVVETTIANIAALLDGRWVTPPLASGCLPGVARAEGLASGRLVEGVLTPDDLTRARAVVRLNAVRGWEPAVLVS